LTLVGKQRLVAAALALLAVWPLAHAALVARYHIDPWRFFGWAMYSTPKLPVRISIYERRGDERVRVAVDDLDPVLRKARQRLVNRRLRWGSLAPVDGFGRQLLAARPEAEVIEIDVHHWYLDRATAHIAARSETFTYRRGDP
jgi:hypothetical protein